MTSHSLHGFKIRSDDNLLMEVEFPAHRPTTSFDADALREVLEFLDRFEVSFDETPPFYQKVYQAMRSIAPGQTWTYARLATQAGNPRAARAVGSACSRNPIPMAVPCHRVVARSGIGAFSGGPGWKAHLLALEKEIFSTK